jgi:hypothetical protein
MIKVSSSKNASRKMPQNAEKSKNFAVKGSKRGEFPQFSACSERQPVEKGGREGVRSVFSGRTLRHRKPQNRKTDQTPDFAVLLHVLPKLAIVSVII